MSGRKPMIAIQQVIDKYNELIGKFGKSDFGRARAAHALSIWLRGQKATVHRLQCDSELWEQRQYKPFPVKPEFNDWYKNNI